MPEILRAQSLEQLDDARMLMRGLVAWINKRYADERHITDRYFDQGGFDAELASLPGKYAPPAGSLLVAYHQGEPAGCVAMRDLGGGFCEMKRMFVAEKFHRLGIGRLLALQLIADARVAGYRCMRLDTGHGQAEAQRFYGNLGFVRVAPYYEMPDEMKRFLMFFELTL